MDQIFKICEKLKVMEVQGEKCGKERKHAGIPHRLFFDVCVLASFLDS